MHQRPWFRSEVICSFPSDSKVRCPDQILKNTILELEGASTPRQRSNWVAQEEQGLYEMHSKQSLGKKRNNLSAKYHS